MMWQMTKSTLIQRCVQCRVTVTICRVCFLFNVHFTTISVHSSFVLKEVLSCTDLL